MPLCTIFLASLTRELATHLTGARIDKVNQPNPQEVVLQVRTHRGNERLLLSANSQSARVAFTESTRENPAQAPMFCMSLRKHLTNSRILGVRQLGCERALEIEVLSHDELGVEGHKKIVCEMMGRNSNVILVGTDGRILDCLKKVDAEMSEKRQVLPGLFYHLPPVQEKLPLDRVESLPLKTGEKRLSDHILDEISGIAPLVAREIAHRATGSVDGVVLPESDEAEKAEAEVLGMKEHFLAGDGIPTLLTDPKTGNPKDFTFFTPRQYEGVYEMRRMASFSELLEEYFAGRDAANAQSQKTLELRRTVDRVRERLVRKMAAQERELEETGKREIYREMADILGAFSYQIPRGAKSVTLPNLYAEEGGEITIPLSEKLTPQQNIRRYYKEYSKLKNAETVLLTQLEEGEKELAYLDSVREEIGRATTQRDIAEIREELTLGGYLKGKKEQKKKNSNKKAAIKPLIFEAPSGKMVLVGRNHLENDRLTLQTAGKTDLWFHVKHIPGSHVVLFLEGEEATDEDILFAASLAAYHSSGKEENKVAVDYTTIRNVKKPNGARPGMVIYERYRTVMAEPKLPGGAV